MRVFHSGNHAGHAPEWYVADGRVRPCPEVPARLEAILGTLREMPEFELVSPDADPGAVVGRVHAGDYLDYLRTIHGVWRAEFGTDVLPDTFPPRGRVARRPGKASAQAGHYCFDLAAPITAGTWGVVLESASCAVSAAKAVLAGERAAYALSRPPGHHAGGDYCGGFCYLNNAAVAAEQLLLGGRQRVAVLDVDYHHGNGTQDIFYARRDVLFVSIHADPNTQYPYFWGYAEETGAGEGEGFTMNLPLARGVSEGEWMRALERAIARIVEFRPEGLVVSLGVDTMEGDEVGDFHLSPAGFAECGRRIGGLGLPTVFIQEGGYTIEKLGVSVAAVLKGFMENPGNY